MFKKFNVTDKLLFTAAILSLIFSEVLFFSGHESQAIFYGAMGAINTMYLEFTYI